MVRNWWIESAIDGRKGFEGGPTNREGGFTIRIYQRDDGDITQPGYITGLATSDGRLILRGNIGGTQFEHITKR